MLAVSALFRLTARIRPNDGETGELLADREDHDGQSSTLRSASAGGIEQFSGRYTRWTP